VLEFEASSERMEETEDESFPTYETVISTKIGDKETLRIELESTMENNLPKKVLQVSVLQKKIPRLGEGTCKNPSSRVGTGGGV